MKHSYPILIVVVLTISSMSCNNVPDLQTYPNPFWGSFWDKNIKYVVFIETKKGKLNNDTLFIQQHSRDMLTKFPNGTEHMKFDEKNFVVRTLYKFGKYVENNVYSYHFLSDKVLIRKGTKIKGAKWDYTQSDIDTVSSITIDTLKLDILGRVIEEITANLTTKSNYDDRGLLIEQIEDQGEQINVRKLYEYDSLNRMSITRIYVDESGSPRILKYSNGLLGSIFNKDGTLTLCSYAFY